MSFCAHLFVSTAGDISHTPTAPTSADFSRYDLNGDGFTTAADRRERFDLDRVGSTQFGASNYSNDVHETVEGQDIHFDETSLTDIQILCYYAYSPLYTGDSDARKNLMAGRCGISVLPATATIRAQQQQQFTVSLPNNDTVAWTITGAGNSITSTGLVTAGTTPGTYTVTATDINSANLTGTATLIVTAGGPDCSALAGINKGLQITISDHTASDQKLSDTLLTLSDDLNTSDSHLSATAAYGSGEVSVTDNNTGRDIPGGSGVSAEASETILIIPNDPSLNRHAASGNRQFKNNGFCFGHRRSCSDWVGHRCRDRQRHFPVLQRPDLYHRRTKPGKYYRRHIHRDWQRNLRPKFHHATLL